MYGSLVNAGFLVFHFPQKGIPQIPKSGMISFLGAFLGKCRMFPDGRFCEG